MAYLPVDDLAGPFGEPHLAAVVQRLEANPGGLVRFRIDEGHVRCVDHRLELVDAACRGLGRALMALHHVHALHENAIALPVDAQNLAFLALVRSEEHTSELQSLMRISYATFC